MENEIVCLQLAYIVKSGALPLQHIFHKILVVLHFFTTKNKTNSGLPYIVIAKRYLQILRLRQV